MELTKKGQPVTLPGVQPAVGEKAPTFTLADLKDKKHQLADFLDKPTIISIVPDIDTRVCAIQTKRFNMEASQIKEINFITVSNNTKTQQATWCGQEGVDMVMLHDPGNTLDESYHLLVPATGHYARVIFVLDKKGIIQYREIVPEISQEPDYEQALTVAKSLI
ncbi:2-Cys peroxiredoxin [Enterococcus saigonensis]|uniref:2-Cys peroxiredoxin n=1 Tax=Enterococcus saigonensis TaxID=1805431 RepID=A0A679IMS8_9ENTE|nr:thiol peroxidase [Enterococcus saigonensis]BCA85084.1 2-Cys peroxiredoxin [Enterococcus saigonensis]